MRKGAQRLIAALALAGGTLGAALLLKRRKSYAVQKKGATGDFTRDSGSRWARPGMNVTVRAELMPGRSAAERTFSVVRLLPSGRVVLRDFAGEHTETEFELTR